MLWFRHDQVLDVALAYAARIAANGPLALALMKELVRLAVFDAPAAKARQRELQPVIWASEDAKEGAHRVRRAARSGLAGPLTVVRAAICREYGPPEVVEIGDVPPPALEPGQVRVRIEAASVNFPDVLFVADSYQFSVPPPFVPGSELAGVVLEAPPMASSAFQVGDRVFGTVTVGAFAQEVVLPAASLTAIPGGVEAGVAAAFGVAHRTAYHVLRSVAPSRSRGRSLSSSAPVVASVWPRCSWRVALGATVTAVASSAGEARRASPERCSRPHRPPHPELRQALEGRAAEGGGCGHRPCRRRPRPSRRCAACTTAAAS